MIQPLGMESNEELRRIRFASRLGELNLNGTANDLTLDFGYDPAGRIASNTRSNDAYAWGGHYAVTRAYTANGLNRYTAAGAITPTYDANGNMTAAGSVGYSYNAENRLVVADHGSTHQELIDDSMDRYRYYDGAANRYLTYDGQSLTAEWNAAGTAIARRYVHGPGTDEPLSITVTVYLTPEFLRIAHLADDRSTATG